MCQYIYEKGHPKENTKCGSRQKADYCSKHVKIEPEIASDSSTVDSSEEEDNVEAFVSKFAGKTLISTSDDDDIEEMTAKKEEKFDAYKYNVVYRGMEYEQWLKQNAVGCFEVSFTLYNPNSTDREFLHETDNCQIFRCCNSTKKGISKYVWLYSPLDVANFVNFVHLDLKHECHEMFLQGSRIKFFIDCDNKLTDAEFKSFDQPIDEFIKQMAEDYIAAFKNVLTYTDHEYEKYENDIDYLITNRSRKIDGGIKISTHIVVNVVFTVREISAIVKSMIKTYIDEIDAGDSYKNFLRESVDTQPYRNNGSLSLPNGVKNGNKNVIIKPFNKKSTSAYLLDMTDCHLTHELTDDLHIVDDSNQKSFEESSSAFIMTALKSIKRIPDYDPAKMDIYGRLPRGNLLLVDRVLPSHCSVCQREHSGDNTLLLIFDEKKQAAWWKCRHADKAIKAKRWFGRSQKEIDFDEDMEFCSNDIEEFRKRATEQIENAKADKEMTAKELIELRNEMIADIASELNKLQKDLIKSETMYVADFVDIEMWNSTAAWAKALKSCYAYIINGTRAKFFKKSKRRIQYAENDFVDVNYYEQVAVKTTNTFEEWTSFTIKFKDKYVKVSLIQVIAQCWRSISYKHVDVFPHSPTEEPAMMDGTFNLFGQYTHQYDPDFVIDQKKVDLWVNHIKHVICNRDEALGEFILNWFAHILQKPQVKTNAVPLIFSKAGAGKNFTFNVFQRYVLNPSMTTTVCDINKITGKFNSICMGKTLILIDEALDSSNVANNNIMKSRITDDKIILEKKGEDAIEVNDFSNYAILTNNHFASPVEKGDRRYVVIKASDERCGIQHKAWWKMMRSELLTMEAGKSIFHWLMRRDLSNFNPSEIVETNYKKELKAKRANTVCRWLLAKRQEMLYGRCQTEITLTHDMSYSMYVKWCGESNEKVLAKSYFGDEINECGFKLKTMKVKQSDGTRKSVKRRTITLEDIEKNLSEYIIPEEEAEEVEE